MSQQRTGLLWFGAPAIILIALRTLLVVTERWTPDFGGDLPEALISGRLAFDLLNGSWRGWPVYLYSWGGHIGNELTVGLMATPLFALFGRSLLTMSLIPTAAAVAGAWFVYSLAESPRAARLAVLYFVLVPVSVHAWLIYPYLAHMESSLFFLAAIWLLWGGPTTGDSAYILRPWRAAAAGVVSGVGVFVCDIQLLGLASVLVGWAVAARGRMGPGAFRRFCAGVLTGMLPYMLYGVYNLAGVVDFYTGLVMHPGAGQSFGKTLALFSPVFWPAGNLAWSDGTRALAVVAGMSGIAFYARTLTRRTRLVPVQVPLLVFVAAFCAIALLLRQPAQFYLYALLPPVSILAGNALSALPVHITAFKKSIDVLPAVLLVASAVSFGPALLALDTSRLGAQWTAVRTARGYAFYWPHPYPVYSGYKTPLGIAVEGRARATAFSESAPVDASSSKEIFVSATLTGRHPLREPADYYLFGADVTYLGLEALARQIRDQVPPAFWNEAFGSAAVFAANDFLIDDLTDAFADGTVDAVVPPGQLHLFYSELGRKIKDTDAGEHPRLRQLLDSFSAEKRAWIMDGGRDARYVDYLIPLWPK